MATRLSRRGGFALIYDRRFDAPPSEHRPVDLERARAELATVLDDEDGVRGLREALLRRDPLAGGAPWSDDEVVARVAGLLGEREMFLERREVDVAGGGGGDVDPVDPVGPVGPVVPVKHWIEVALRDPAGDPVRFARYRIELPDGTVSEGALDAAGNARVAGLDAAGTCKISFPQLDGRALRRA